MKFFSLRKKSIISGFTLIELLVVIAIIGVLASIVLASLNSARQKSRDARRIADIKQLQLALELYYDAQSPPAYPVATVYGPSTCTATLSTGLEVLASGGYIPQVARDPNLPAATNCYWYATNTSGTVNSTYHLGATLEQTTNPVLNSDKDCVSTGTASGCPATAYVNGFAGTDPIYDAVP
ncbi:MAG: type II secretion system protein [Candidatus Sungiibacteriota bacterium]